MQPRHLLLLVTGTSIALAACSHSPQLAMACENGPSTSTTMPLMVCRGRKLLHWLKKTLHLTYRPEVDASSHNV